MEKYVVVLCDGMADLPCDELSGKTPMEFAKKPNMDFFAKNGEIGLIKTVADGLSPGSDVANLSVMGYDPKECYTGRSPLEAVSMGIEMNDTDVALRCNLVTLSDDADYADKTMVDYCAGDISTQEAAILIEDVNKALGNEIFAYHAGIQYRHCLIWHNGNAEIGHLTPPHDISGRVIGEYLNGTDDAMPLIEMMKKSYDILKNHPVNLKRIENGKRPANSIWLWGQGTKPALVAFEEKFGKKGSIISAVDLLKGIGICAKMNVCEVEGATGYIDTCFEDKTLAGLKELENGQDFIYLHFEAPDECGHRKEAQNKIRAIELIDERVLSILRKELDKYDNYKMLILPDHPTPLCTGTHTSDPVPFIMYEKNGKNGSGADTFTEKSAKDSGRYIDFGPSLMEKFLK